MFKKSFRTKSNSQMKSSDKRNLRELIQKTFPNLTEADVEEVLPKKETVFCSKVLTASNKHAIIYSMQKRAIFFYAEDRLYPSIYLLWKYPQLGITFTTNDFVFAKIVNGADLMVPGVFGDPTEQGSFLRKQVAVINNISNSSAIAVGEIAMSSNEMKGARVGKCVFVRHFYGDKLCSMEDMSVLPLPDREPPRCDEELNGQTIFEGSSNDELDEVVSNDDSVDSKTEKEEAEAQEEDMPETKSDDVEHMDEILRICFLTALKYSKTLEIPILTSAFYKLEMIAACPPQESVDVKRSSYKKIGQFLKAMESEGFIVIKERKKGVESIEAINRDHEIYRKFYLEVEKRPRKQIGEEAEEQTRNIVESLAVTAAVLPLFKEFGVNKGETMTTTEIRKYVTNYVKQHQLQDADNKRFVNVKNDAMLKALCQDEDAVIWEDLMQTIISSMKTCFKITTGLEATVSKGSIPPIVMSTQTRASNKKVTIVDNLELYQIKIAEFAKECQHGVAASTSVSRPPGKKADQLLIQGNQILFVYNLLTGKYNIPKKYIRGLEFAPKKAKK